jgi:hypothetical protein
MTDVSVPESWQAYRESMRTTLLRTGIIAAVVGAILAGSRGGGIGGGGWRMWPLATLLSLWPALGGHFVELLFLNVLRPRLPRARAVQIAARLITWFAGGVAMVYAIRMTALALTGTSPLRATQWWIGGVGFIAIELIVHAVLQMRGRPSFYNGRG